MKCCSDLYALPLLHALLGENFHPGGLVLTRRLAAKLRLTPGQWVLDLAAGRGASTTLLAQEHGCELLALDRGRDNLRAAPCHPRIRPLQGDAAALPLATGSVDAIICECALCTFDDPGAALAEALRVLRPGGWLGLSDVTLHQPLPAPLRQGAAQALCLAGAQPPAGYRRLLDQAGFRRLRIQQANTALQEFLQRIENRYHRLTRLQNGGLDAAITQAGLDPGQLGAARDFIRQGGAGYALITARKPAV